MLTFPPHSFAPPFAMRRPSEVVSYLVERDIGSLIAAADLKAGSEEYRREGDSIEVQQKRLSDAVRSGDLAAFVQPLGDAGFYRVPAEHWNPDGFMEGEVADTLFCWDASDVPARLHGAPVFFLWSDVLGWAGESRLQARGPIAEAAYAETGMLSDRLTDFHHDYPDNLRPQRGYWSALSAIAWVATRSEWFTACVQQYERDECANRSDVHGAAAQLVVWENIAAFVGQVGDALVAKQAESDLQARLEGGDIEGIAKPIGERNSIPLKRYQFVDWKLTFEPRCGAVFVPGYWDLMVDSEQLVAEFPRSAPTPASEAKGHWNKPDLLAALKALHAEDPEGFSANQAPNVINDRYPEKYASRSQVREAIASLGLKRERGRKPITNSPKI